MPELEVELLDAAAGAHGPALVAEVPLQLADDRPGREGGEVDAAGRVEPVDRLDQRHRRHLHEVVQRLAPVEEASGELVGQPEVGGDQLLACGRIEGWTVRSRGVRQRPGIVFPALRHSACPPRRLRSQARTEPSWLSRPCSSTSASRICSLSRATSSPSGPGALAAPARSRVQTTSMASPEHAQLETEVAVLRVTPLQRQKAELADSEPQVLQLLDVEPGPGGDRTRDQAGEHNEIAPRRELQLNPIAALQPVGRLGHAAPADSSESAMVKTLVRPVISKILTMRGSATTTCSSPPSSRQRLSAPTRTPERRGVEERHPEQVEDDRRLALRDDAVQALAQLRSGGDVDLPADRDHRRRRARPLLNLKVLIHSALLWAHPPATPRTTCNADWPGRSIAAGATEPKPPGATGVSSRAHMGRELHVQPR